jgi:hypothetical protein
MLALATPLEPRAPASNLLLRLEVAAYFVLSLVFNCAIVGVGTAFAPRPCHSWPDYYYTIWAREIPWQYSVSLFAPVPFDIMVVSILLFSRMPISRRLLLDIWIAGTAAGLFLLPALAGVWVTVLPLVLHCIGLAFVGLRRRKLLGSNAVE